MIDDPRSPLQTLPRTPANGVAPDQSAVSDARGKRIANRTPWLELPEPFDNLRVRVWLDYPQEIANLWTAPPDETPDAAQARVLEACKTVILQHDGWQDGRGETLPQPDSDEFWDRIPSALAGAIVTEFVAAIQAGNSPASARARRRSWKRR